MTLLHSYSTPFVWNRKWGRKLYVGQRRSATRKLSGKWVGTMAEVGRGANGGCAGVFESTLINLQSCFHAARRIRILFFCSLWLRIVNESFEKLTEWPSLLRAQLLLTCVKQVPCSNDSVNSCFPLALCRYRYSERAYIELLHLVAFR